jgi:transglutaminase-like putative cysteine protease
VIAFAGLATLAGVRYAALDLNPPLARVLGAIALAVAGGALLARTPASGAPRARAALRAARILLLVATLAGALLVIGLPAHLLWPGHWGTLNVDVHRGLDGLSGWLWPYRGADRWARLTVLLVLPVAQVLAAALYLWPSARRLGLRRAGALGVLTALYVAGVVNGSHAGWQVEGLLLAAAVCAWVYLPGFDPRTAGGAATWLVVAAVVAVVVAGAVSGGRPWLNYRAWNPTGADATSFQWDQLYGPITWSRSTATMFEVTAERPELWKVTSLDRFDGLRFLRSAAPPGGSDFGGAPGDGQWYEQATIKVSGLRSRLLVAAGTPVEVGWLSSDDQDIDVASDETQAVRTQLAPGDSYYVTYYAPHPSAARLRAAPAAYPRAYLAYTGFDLPAPRQSGLEPAVLDATVSPHDPRLIQSPAPGRTVADDPGAVRRILASPYAGVYRLARGLARGARTRYDVAARVQSFLRGGYTYDEHPPARQYPLAAFLFTDRRGYCQQFSGAMALMLRMDGIPARVAAGFRGGQPDHGRYRLRAVDAHSWVEVFFAGLGWVAFDPTPPRSASPRPPAATPFFDQALLSAAGGATRAGFVPPPRRPESAPNGVASRSHSTPWVWFVAIAGGLAALLIGAWCAVSSVRVRRGLGGDAAGAVWELRGALRALGYPVAPRTTLAQLQRRLLITRGPEAARYVELLAARRYAGAPPAHGPTRRDRRALRRALSEGRGPLARLLALWMLPPAT